MAITAPTAGTYIELDDAWADPGWTRVPNSIARCTTISRRVKGWILEVASHAPGRRLTFAEMLACSTDGRDATYATITEAIDAGLVTRRQERGKRGRMGIVVYRVHVTPQNPRSEPLPGKPDTVAPDTAKPEGKEQKTRKNLEDQTPTPDTGVSTPGGADIRSKSTPEANASAPRQRAAAPRVDKDRNLPRSQAQPGDQKTGQDEGVAPSSPAAVPATRAYERRQWAGRDEATRRRLDYAMKLAGVVDPDGAQLNAAQDMLDRGKHWRYVVNWLAKNPDFTYAE